MTEATSTVEPPSDGVAEPVVARGAQLTPGYRVIGHLARNQATDVYEVWDEHRYCRCVAKVVRPSRRHEVRPRERLIREGHLLESFAHPNLVRAYETVERPEPAVILETLTGATLAGLIRGRARRLSLLDLVHLGLQLASAVGYLHRRGILHLDLKPSNVVAENGLVKVLDLSLARPPGAIRAGLGTRGYRSPEQGRGGPVSTAADVWGIGITVYEAAAGRLPFADDEGDDPQLRRAADSIRASRRLPSGFTTAVDACLFLRPEDRPSLTEFTCALEAFTDDWGAALLTRPDRWSGE